MTLKGFKGFGRSVRFVHLAGVFWLTYDLILGRLVHDDYSQG